MILSPNELLVIKPALALIDQSNHLNIILTLKVPGHRTVTLDISAGGVAVKAEWPDSSPAWEHYKHPMGLAQAYGLPLAKVAHAKAAA
jgi:hypothetical protein